VEQEWIYATKEIKKEPMKMYLRGAPTFSVPTLQPFGRVEQEWIYCTKKNQEKNQENQATTKKVDSETSPSNYVGIIGV